MIRDSWRIGILALLVILGGVALIFCALRRLDQPAAFFAGALSLAVPGLLDALGIRWRRNNGNSLRPPRGPDSPG